MVAVKARWVRRNWRPISLPIPPYSSASKATCALTHGQGEDVRLSGPRPEHVITGSKLQIHRSKALRDILGDGSAQD